MPKSLKYALYMSVASIALSLILFALGLDKEQALGMLGIVFTVLFLYLGIKDKKETEGNGFLTFGEGFKRGAAITVIASIINSVFTYIYLSMINLELKDFQMEKEYDKMIERGMSEDQIDMSMNMMDKYFAFFGIGGALVGGIIIGLVISLIISAILKKENPDAMSA
ncbi:MAG: DUF4199 domain-containing protein [Bacteroidia bacterium]|nr:DUF4199 domain-containing protein [Bacteroidia bacterium]NNM16373.1 DUF4199 domain-containing protein [Bacteroidia bacterium]